MAPAARDSAERRSVTLRLTRDSVAMGDDVDAPHERVVEVPAVADPVALVRSLVPGYLANVFGLGHSWTCALNGRTIATIAGNGPSVRAEVREVTYAAGANDVHFRYTSAIW